MRALVTGAAGFIGGHFTDALAARGWQVTGVDVKPCPAPVPFAAYAQADCREWFRAAGARARPFDLVVHAAAIVGGRQMIDGEPLTVATDLAIDSDLFQWAALTQPGRVLYFSSSAAYPIALQDRMPPRRLREEWIGLDDDPAGTTRDDPADYECEDYDHRAPWFPDQSYGWVKLTGEMLAGLARAEGVPVTVVRPFSGYGTDQDDTYPFPAFMRRARDVVHHGLSVFTVWGDGRQVRDFVHVDDVVAACFAIMDSGTTDPVNICTGIGTSFDELAGLVLDLAGAPRGAARPEIVHDTTKPTGVAYRVGDPSRLHEHYRPTVTLAEGIERALRGVL